MTITTELGYEVSTINTDSEGRICVCFINPMDPEQQIILTKSDMQGLLDNWIGIPEDHE